MPASWVDALGSSTPTSQSAPLYECPACKQLFAQHITALYPPNAPWYRLQNKLPACTSCKAAITWLKLPRPGIREQRWQALAYLSSMMQQALLLFLGPELLAHHHLLVILFLVFYVFALMRIAPTKPDGSGQWMLPSEAKTLESNVFGLPLPLLGILVALLLARLLTLLPPMGIVCMAIVLCAISVFANMMASHSARRAKHGAATAPDTPPTPLC